MDRPLHDVKANVGHQPNSRRAIALVIVGIIHVGLIYALAVGLAQSLIQKLPEEIKVAVEQPKPEKAPPPPPPPDLAKPPPPSVPPPEIVIQQSAPSTAPTVQLHKEVPAAPAPKAQISSPVGIGKPHVCGAKYYPESSIRLQEEGTTLLSFTVTADGSVSNPTVSQSSGHDRLDQAAIECASSWKYKPAVQNGTAVAVPWQTQIQWKLPK
ncbi:MAG: TonB family protein [Alphaproteobacteria bacterium]|nr:TonB family protein [Alphaproteobacteria bacterium]